MKLQDWKDAVRLSIGKNSNLQDIAAQDYRNYRLTPMDILREGSVGVGLSFLISYTFYRSFAALILLAPAAFVVFPIIRRPALKEKRLWELTVQFKEAIWIMSGFLSAGLSVENALAMSLPELQKLYGKEAMIVQEFQQINRGVKLNKPLETLLNDFARRSGLQDIRNFTEVFAIAKRNGGSLKEIIERTGRIIRDKTAVSEDIKNMTASRRYEQNIMNILPFGIVLYINLTSNGFLDVMYESFMGRVIMTVCLILIGLSYFLSQKILCIKV